MQTLLRLGSCLAFSLFWLVFINRTEGHSPAPLPLHHVVSLIGLSHAHPASRATAFQLLALLSKGSRKSFPDSALIAQAHTAFYPGSHTLLSGSAKAVLQQYASLTANGVNEGESLGVVSFAQFNDRFYYQPVGSTYHVDIQEVDTIGNNPLNNGLVGNRISIANSGLNQITLAKPQTLGVRSLAALKILPHSGATEASLNKYALLTRNAVAAGRNLVSHPLGGQISGTWYAPTINPSTFRAGGLFVFAFGNNPFNNPALTQINVPNPSSFLLLANGRKLFIHNGEFLSTYYAQLGSGKFESAGYNVYAIGNNPLNQGLAGPNIPVNPSTFVNFLSK